MASAPGSHRDDTSWIDGDRLREECGVFGIFNHRDAAALTVLGLHAFSTAGRRPSASSPLTASKYHSERRLGLVGDNFTASRSEHLKGSAAMGHVRYSTTGDTLLRNVQPLFARPGRGGFALGHNGNLTNALTCAISSSSGRHLPVHHRQRVILHLVARSKKPRVVERFIDALLRSRGVRPPSVSPQKLIGARDPLGIRPLVSAVSRYVVLASETCALDIIGAEFVREVENGGGRHQQEGVESHRPFPNVPPAPASSNISTSPPDSILGGRCVYESGRASASSWPARRPCPPT